VEGPGAPFGNPADRSVFGPKARPQPADSPGVAEPGLGSAQGGTMKAIATTHAARSHVMLGLRWDDRKERPKAAASLVAAVALLAAFTASFAPARTSSGHTGTVRVIVRAQEEAARTLDAAVEAVGGTFERRIPLIAGAIVDVPAQALGALVRTDGIASVTVDRPVHLLSQEWRAGTDDGSFLSVTKLSGARDLWRAGFTGTGVDVALIDSGVAPVPGLDGPGKLLNGADLSFDAPSDALRNLDAFGHGTHLAGIIAGRDASVESGEEFQNRDAFLGMAPDARVVNVKVAAVNGVTDVSQVIAAIDWVVRHRSAHGLNVQVLALAFGTDSVQDYRVDPLAFAAEQAWHAGITVVVSGGNAGAAEGRLTDPASDPYLIAVGADDPNGTYPANDDTVPVWSSRGDAVRSPDLVAPGVSVASLRDPGSWVDTAYPEARLDDRYFRGSGTSQAAAVVAGAAALLEQQRPGLTPDQTKALLVSTAWRLPDAEPRAQGGGELDLRSAMKAPTPAVEQTWPRSDGSGSLEASRGSVHVVGPDGQELVGDVDVFGQPWDALRWSDMQWEALRWSTTTWSGLAWSDLAWDALRWSSLRWSALRWSSLHWSGLSWDALRWSALRWSSLRWSSLRWSTDVWSATVWG
jgi:serine protease AprX